MILDHKGNNSYKKQIILDQVRNVQNIYYVCGHVYFLKCSS